MDIAQGLVAHLELLARDGRDQLDYLRNSAFTDLCNIILSLKISFSNLLGQLGGS